MILGAFGDSFLYGSDLKDCNSKQHSLSTWPALLAKKLGLEYQCYASPGVGNHYIFEQILDCYETHGSNVLYIVNWTWIDRFDYLTTDNEWKTVRPSLDNKRVDSFYYKHFHSEYKDKISSLQNIYTAMNVLQDNNCTFSMTFMDHLLFDRTWNHSPAINNLQKQVFYKMNNFDGKTFLEWSRKKGFAESDKWHPLEEAHQHAARYWSSAYEKLLQKHN